MGIHYWPNGNWEEGGYKNSQPHGKAIYHYVNGKTEERVYENGKKLVNNSQVKVHSKTLN